MKILVTYKTQQSKDAEEEQEKIKRELDNYTSNLSAEELEKLSLKSEIGFDKNKEWSYNDYYNNSPEIIILLLWGKSLRIRSQIQTRRITYQRGETKRRPMQE